MGRPRSSTRSGWTHRPGPCSSPTRAPRTGAGRVQRRDPPPPPGGPAAGRRRRPATRSSRGVTAWLVRCLEEGAPHRRPGAHGSPTSIAIARSSRPPAATRCLRTALSQVPRPGVFVRVLRARRPSRRRGRHGAHVPPRPDQSRAVRGAGTALRGRGRLHVPGLALPDRPECRGQPAARPSAATAGARSRPPRWSTTRSMSRATPRRARRRPRPGRAVGRLAGDRRRAVVLRFVEEMSTAEIAGVLGKSEGAVRVLIHRALRSVARDLGGRDR